MIFRRCGEVIGRQLNSTTSKSSFFNRKSPLYGNISRRLCTNINQSALEEAWKEGMSLEETAYNLIHNCEFEKATELLKKSINIRTSKNEEAMDTVRMYQTWTNLGGLYQTQGDYQNHVIRLSLVIVIK
jgi:hypothetical protein